MREKIRTIRLYGKLGAQFGRVHRLAVRSTAEAVRALCVMIPGFERELNESKNKGVAYAVFIGKRNIGADNLQEPTGNDDIRIAPIVGGRKSGGIFQVVVGVVLVIAGFFTGGATWGPALMMAGGAMALSGAMMMLSPQAKSQSADDNKDGTRASYNFNGPVNTSAQGKPVPLLYGEMITGSAVISGGIWTEDII